MAAPRSAPGRTRVLHVIQNLNYGGMERLLADLVRRIDRTRFESHVLVLQYFGRFADGLGDVATLHRAPPMSKGSMIWPRALARRIRAIRPDVVHTHSGVWYKASLAARLAGVPLVVHTEHGRQSPDPWLARWVDGLASRRTDVVVAVSGSVAEQLRARVVRRGCRVEVVENGVDTELHAPLADTGRIRRELGIATDVPILGSIGRLERIKGYDVMIEAFARLHALWPPSAVRPALVLAGEGSERPKLEALAATLGIREHVRFLGWRDDIRDLHSAFTVFTMSSRSEGTSVSLLEAMSAGLCPVVTAVGGNPAVLGDSLEHRLVPPEDPDALAHAWLDALLDGARRAADGRAARARVVEAYGLDRMVSRYERIYESAAARSPVRRG